MQNAAAELFIWFNALTQIAWWRKIIDVNWARGLNSAIAWSVLCTIKFFKLLHLLLLLLFLVTLFIFLLKMSCCVVKISLVKQKVKNESHFIFTTSRLMATRIRQVSRRHCVLHIFLLTYLFTQNCHRICSMYRLLPSSRVCFVLYVFDHASMGWLNKSGKSTNISGFNIAYEAANCCSACFSTSTN